MKFDNVMVVGRLFLSFVLLVHCYVYSIIIIPLGHGRDSGQYVKVYMKDGSVLYGGYVIFESESRGRKELTIQLNGDGRKIKPFETDSIEVDFLIGKPFNNDFCWVYKIINGEISAYSNKPLWETKRFTHIQKADSPIKPYSRKLLKSYLSDKKYPLEIYNQTWSRSETRFQHLGSKEAILEYNFQNHSNEMKVENLLKLIRKSSDINVRYKHANQILDIDSTNHIAFEIFGDYEKFNNKDNEKAYFYYTNSIRYCPTKYYISLAKKIKAIGKSVLY